METCIALFRGINVGGKNLLPMQEVVAILETIGAQKIKTYIQSGNAVFACNEEDVPQIPTKIKAEIGRRHGFEPHLLVLTLTDLETAIEENPFPEAEAEPTTLHLGFLACAPPNPDLNRLDNIKTGSERYHLGAKVFYLHAPEGVGRSKLAASAEEALAVPMTYRNWRTVCKIREMAIS
jgi:uncharacterized protein (DUF1697 family)